MSASISEVLAGPRPGPASPASPRVHRLPLLDTCRETASVLSFRFGGPRLSYRPGQSVSLELRDVDDPRGPRRSFTLSSSPTEEGWVAITTRMTGSPFKERLRSLSPGDVVEMRGPVGRFTLEEGRAALLVAGGIGITPFRSMLRFAADTGSRQPTALLYANPTVEEIAFREELDRLAERLPALEVVPTITRPQYSEALWTGEAGRIDARMIRKACRRLDRPAAYVCGPPAMVREIRRALLESLGFAEADVRVEEFPGY